MVRGRGRWRGGNRGGRGQNPPIRRSTRANNQNTPTIPPSDDCAPCGMCTLPVGNDGIGCDSCDKWYHPTPICVGLPQNAIDSIISFGGDGLTYSYSCSQCRVSRGGNQNDQSNTIKQLFETVKNLCVTVTELSKNVTNLMEKMNNSQSRGQDSSSSNLGSGSRDTTRVIIREEFWSWRSRKGAKTLSL